MYHDGSPSKHGENLGQRRLKGLRNRRLPICSQANKNDLKGRQDLIKHIVFECGKTKHAVQFKTSLDKLALFVER